MSRLKSFLVLAFLPFLALGSASAQSAVSEAPSVPAGSVTGFVYDSETRLPLRFALIYIVTLPSRGAVLPANNQPAVAQQPERRVQSVSGTSGMDGGFRLDVPAGDYIVTASKAGYVTPGAAAAMDFSLTEDQLESVIASLPQVHVGAGGFASVNVTLHRGAVITGRMRYADGSPATGAVVSCESNASVLNLEFAMRPENRGRVPSPLQQALQSLSSVQSIPLRGMTTDDEGRYRVYGLLPGKYLLSTLMVMDHSAGRVAMNDGRNPDTGRGGNQYPEGVPVYVPATFRRKDAKVFEIRGDEKITDADLTIDPNSVHTLKGKILAADDHRAPSTMVRLKEVSEKMASRLVGIEDDGTFQFNYLPPGSYTLLITAFGVPDPSKPGVIPAEYKVVEVSALIADHDVLLDDLLLVPLKPGEHNDFSLLF